MGMAALSIQGCRFYVILWRMNPVWFLREITCEILGGFCGGPYLIILNLRNIYENQYHIICSIFLCHHDSHPCGYCHY